MVVINQKRLSRLIFWNTDLASPACIYGWGLTILLTCMALFPVTVMADGKDKAAINCDIQKGVCIQALAGRTISLDIHPRPVRAMQDLTFEVRMTDASAKLALPHIRLNMPAMDMGKNMVPLKLKAKGVYEGKGVIVRCRSGRRTWKATVDFPDLGSVDFIFDVIYE